MARGIFEAMPDSSSVQNLVHFGWEALWFALASAAIYFGRVDVHAPCGLRTARNMRFRAAKHLVDLPLGYFTSNQSGGLAK